MAETIEVRSIDGMIDAIERIRPRTGAPLWYRGQCDAAWSVQPALWRRGTQRPYTAADERNFTHWFRTRAAIRYPSTPLYNDHSAWLSLMQHYGLPTRLLDWSRSPLVAAYFALEVYLEPSEVDEKDAAVWVLSPHRLNRRFAGFDVTPAINSGDCKHLIRPAFHDAPKLENPRHPGTVIAAMATELDLRMFVQQGCFTIHSPDAEPLEDPVISHDTLWRMLIPGTVVNRFARHMDDLGFRVGDLFPDLQNLANELKRSHPPGSVLGMKGRNGFDFPNDYQ